MSSHKHNRQQARADEGLDDGLALRSNRRRRSSHGRGKGHGPGRDSGPAVDHKALQLCKQVAHTLADLLAGDCDDEILRGLDVLAVQPAPDASRLLVTLAPGAAACPCPPEEVISRLNGVARHLRSEVASAITRRKAPTLIYQVIPDLRGIDTRDG